MNKAELIEALADKTGLQKQEAKKVLDTICGKNINLSRLGKKIREE